MSEPVLGLIPARGGSKGIPDKNLRPLAGKPLIAHAAEAARRSGVVDRTILSTDSERIAELGRELGIEVPFVRPAELADDHSPMLDVVRHALEALDAEGWRAGSVALLQPTAPLRRPEHLRRAKALLDQERCDSVVSVVPIPPHLSPHYAMRIDRGRLVNFLPEGEAVKRRQDVEPAFSRDGTVYLLRADQIRAGGGLYGADSRPLVLPEEESVNLDSAADWERAERLLETGPSL